MKNQNVKPLTNTEVQEILAIQKWGTYSQEYPLCYESSINGAPMKVHSFSLNNVPQLDLLVVFGGYPRLVKHLGEVWMKHDHLYSDTEVEIAMLGYKPNKGQDTPGSEAQIYASLLEQLGFDSKRVRKNLIQTFATDTVGNVAELRQIIQNSPVLSQVDCPRIGMVTHAGYSLTAAQQFGLLMPEVEFYFYETPLTLLCDRSFDVESIVNGYAVDVIVGCALRTMMNWDRERLPLSDEKIALFPKLTSEPNPAGLLKTIKKYFLKGYTFYMPYKEMWEMLGIPAAEALPLVNQRKVEITGINVDGKKVGAGWSSSSVPELQKQLHIMVESILDEWIKTGKMPL